jgi:hypothetical protein
MTIDAKTRRKKDMARLRRRMDGDDRFINAHQIKTIRTRERHIPTWVLNDKEVQKVLLRAFPDLKRNRVMGKRAGRWTRAIHLYYRVQLSNSQVAKEMGLNLNTTKMMLKSIRRVAKGRRADNTAMLGASPKGRPKHKT